MVEVDEGVGGPELLPQLVPRNDVAAPVEQEQKDVERSAAQFDGAALLSELARWAVDLEQAETIRSRRNPTLACMRSWRVETAILNRMRPRREAMSVQRLTE